MLSFSTSYINEIACQLHFMSRKYGNNKMKEAALN